MINDEKNLKFISNEIHHPCWKEMNIDKSQMIKQTLHFRHHEKRMALGWKQKTWIGNSFKEYQMKVLDNDFTAWNFLNRQITLNQSNQKKDQLSSLLMSKISSRQALIFHKLTQTEIVWWDQSKDFCLHERWIYQ